MVGAKFAAQVLVAVSGLLPGDPNGAPPAPGVQQPPAESFERRIEQFERQIQEANREMEATRLRVREAMRRVLEGKLKTDRETLTRARAMLKGFDVQHGPPTKADFTFIRFLRSWEASLREQIKRDEAALAELDSPPKPKPPAPGVQEPEAGSLPRKVEWLRRRMEEFDRQMQERDRRTAETLRELETPRRKNDTLARELHESALKQSEEALAGIRATLKSLHSAGPPTASEFLRIHRLSAEEAILRERIRFHEAELAKLGPPPKP